jgi:catechol 2,3-dioxygenase-like lactoylglutathione lyase family enzyme
MAIGIVRLDHVQITVGPDDVERSVAFYEALGFERIPKPNPRPGAWFSLGAVELHIGVEATTRAANEASKRHLCFIVGDLAVAESALRSHGVAIIADADPVAGWSRFYVRDPGGNRIEIARLDRQA